MTEFEVSPEILSHYARFDEASRLATDDGRLEAIRTLELLGRYLPAARARILDVGGGPGYYARRLTEAGYEVHLIDPVPRHVEQASVEVGGVRLASACLGDARSLDYPDAWFDAVLLLGPLYHLVERSDRIAALGEARRVLKPGGVMAAAGVSKFVSAIDGLWSGFIDDPHFRTIVYRDLEDGIHLNPTGRVEYFTTAFFTHPAELRAEVQEAGFAAVELRAVEGFGWATHDLGEVLDDPERRERLLEVIRRTEAEPTLLGASPHLLAVGRR
jgi:ubiquinone/menaquinone biosynthesis C-methylase UbiE